VNASWNDLSFEAVDMASSASPIPLRSSYSYKTNTMRGISRQSSYRNATQNSYSRPETRISPSRLKVSNQSAIATKHGSDSSDDDLPVEPMKFSAETYALLNGESEVLPTRYSPALETKSRVGYATPGYPSQDSIDRKPSPVEVSPSTGLARRVVRLSVGSTPRSGLRAKTVPSDALSGKGSLFNSNSPNLVTPAPRARSSMDLVPSPGYANDDFRSSQPARGFNEDEMPDTAARPVNGIESSGGHRFGQSTTATRTRFGEDQGPTVHGSSIRPKRFGKVTGSFLKGPARRGRRRQSEEQESPVPERHLQTNYDYNGSPRKSPVIEEEKLDHGRLQQSSNREDRPNHVRFDSGSPLMKTIDAQYPSYSATTPPPLTRSISASSHSQPMQPASQNIYTIPPATHQHEAALDQENLLPATTSKTGPKIFKIVDDLAKKDIAPKVHSIPPQSPVLQDANRKVLAVKSHNTPHRPAPPPPKMSSLETPAAPTGVPAAAQSKKRRNVLAVNGKPYTRLDSIGSGGSSRVYRVMSENHKIMALKKVSLEGVDELAIRGFKGEIDLLRKLAGVDRVVQLVDFEINDKKQTLSVVSYII
jgi:serine/threonine-protein kinase TTK/MPS1